MKSPKSNEDDFGGESGSVNQSLSSEDLLSQPCKGNSSSSRDTEITEIRKASGFSLVRGGFWTKICGSEP